MILQNLSKMRIINLTPNSDWYIFIGFRIEGKKERVLHSRHVSRVTNWQLWECRSIENITPIFFESIQTFFRNQIKKVYQTVKLDFMNHIQYIWKE